MEVVIVDVVVAVVVVVGPGGKGEDAKGNSKKEQH